MQCGGCLGGRSGGGGGDVLGECGGRGAVAAADGGVVKCVVLGGV